jgi:hypothetical protein
MLALAATCLVAALVGAPTAGAASAGNAKAKSAQKAKASITKKALNRSIRAVRRRANANRRNIIALQGSLATLETSLRGAITGGDKTIDDKINSIVGLVTPVLTQLGNAARDLEAGLRTLAARTTEGFAQVSAGFDEVEAALTDVGDFLGATEYGFGQVMVVSEGPTQNAQLGSFIVTPDIPDTVQQAMTHQEFIAQHTGNLLVLNGVRTGENDGTGVANPAAHCRIRVTNEAGDTATTAANPALGGLPFQPVPEGSALTSEDEDNQQFPFGLKTDDEDGEADKFGPFPTNVAVAAGDKYEVEMSCVDLSPDAEDPEA